MSITIERKVDFANAQHGRKRLHEKDAATSPSEPGHVPRVARLLALAIRFESLVRTGAVADYAELARLGNVSRARITQIFNLLHLAPDIQEAILFLPWCEREPVHERQLRAMTKVHCWKKQRPMWREMRSFW